MFEELRSAAVNRVISYVKDSYQKDPIRIILELLLLFIALKYLFSREVSKKKEVLKEKEITALIEEWAPSEIADSVIFEESSTNFHIDLRDSKFYEHPNELTTDLDTVIEKYGVGTCGPRGFYGTIDLHQILEDKVAQFLEQESAAIYSQAFSALSSTIPAFVKRDDIVFTDEYCNEAIKTGLKISRGTVYTFAHNDLEDLEMKLIEIESILSEKKIVPPRKFIVIEALYFNTGAICPLEKIVTLKEKYKCRIILDESCSLGTISFKGGMPKQVGIGSETVDITLGSFTNSVGCAGGFSSGNIHVSDHQRLSSQAYCFSASMPALLTKYSISVLDLLESNDYKEVKDLRQMVELFYSNLKLTPSFYFICSRSSPIVAIAAKEEGRIISLYQSLVNNGFGVNLVELVDQKVVQFFLTTKHKDQTQEIITTLEKAMLNA